MYPVSTAFHTLALQDSPQTRIRIFFIDDTIDCTDDNDVQTNGTLLVGADGDTDSNKRISESGVSFGNFFNPDKNIQIGLATSSQVQMTLLNFDGALSGYPYGRCKIYLDVYDGTNEVWLPCPMGVYLLDRPTAFRKKLVAVSGFDQMQKLDVIADSWWNGLDWSAGVARTDILDGIATQVGLKASTRSASYMINRTVTYYEAPFAAVQMTYRDILKKLAESTGTIARFDRNGYLDMWWFATASISGNTVTINTDTVGNNCLSLDVAEYSAAVIDKLLVLTEDTADVDHGTGDNVYTICNNLLVGKGNAGLISTRTAPIYTRLNALPAYNPISGKFIIDWSLEAGDIINIVRDGTTYALPIFQQQLTWRSGYVLSDLFSDGDQERPIMSEYQRETFRSDTQFHEFEVTLNELRSRIESLNGDYSEILQNVNSIERKVGNSEQSISDILNPDGEIWTAIKGNANDITSVNDNLTNEVNYRESYIRFLPAEPAIVLGVNTSNEIKLKLVNDVIYFFRGSDDSTDLSLAYAYFNSQEAGADRFVASESVTVKDWAWRQLSNGDLVLDYIG